MKLVTTVFLFALIFVLPAPSPARQGEDARVRAGIEAANTQFSRAFARQDAKAVAAMYSSDAMVLPPDSEPIHGTAAIERFWQATMDSGVKSVALSTIDIGSSGTLAYETGRVTLNIQAAGQSPSTVAAKYVVVWKRERSSWKIHRDIWNSLPAKK